MNDNVAYLLVVCTFSILILIVSFIIIFIRHQNKLISKQEELQEARIKHQNELLKTIILAQENERQRIGEDLHDGVGNSLAQLRLIIEIFKYNPEANLIDFTLNCKSLIDKIIEDLRNISHNLSPHGFLKNGLIMSLTESCQPIMRTGRLEIRIEDQSNGQVERLNVLQSVSIYRIIEELIQNTIKHANATTADLRITANEEELRFIYHDNGIGLADKVKAGMGTTNIASRMSVIGAVKELTDLESRGFSFCFKLKI